MTATIQIPMPPLLKKFLQYKQAISPEEPLVFPKQHYINKFLRTELVNIDALASMPIDERENVQQYYSSASPPPSGRQGVAVAIIAIPNFSGWKVCHKKRFLTIGKKRKFIKTVKAIYNHELEQFYWANEHGKSKQNVANLWLEELHVDDEILPKSQWRAFYRKINL